MIFLTIANYARLERSGDGLNEMSATYEKKRKLLCCVKILNTSALKRNSNFKSMKNIIDGENGGEGGEEWHLH